jgi:regulator of sirC expression with transglutaminase-like and TPR domain
VGVSKTSALPLGSDDISIVALFSARRFTTPDSPAELRDEGLCLYALERYSEAAESLEQYLQQSTWGPDHKQVWS